MADAAPAEHDLLLLLPSMAYSEGLLDALPFIRYFGERSLSDLAALRDPRRRVVLLTAEAIDPWIVERTLADLSEGDERLRADMRRRLACVVPSRRGREPLADAVLGDPATLGRLRDDVAAATSALLVNFSASPATDALAAELGVPAEEGPAGLADRWGTKAGSKTVFREAGVPCPAGELEVLRSVEDATRAALALAASSEAQRTRVIVKLDAADWGDGLGNAVVRSDELLRTGDLAGAVESLLQPWDGYARELAAGGAIVEGYVEHASGWPSGQGRIDPAGGFELLAVHEQLLDAGEYRGCRFPVDARVADAVSGAMTRIAAALARRGVRGSFGVDFILAEGRVYATEINLRKIGPSHVIKAVHARAGLDASADGRGSIMGLPIAYVNRRLQDPELLTALSPRAAVEALERAGLGYERETGTGVLLQIMGALAPVGFVETISLARSGPLASELDRRAEDVLRTAARDALAPSRSAGG
jgi:L-propargylglycine--L-glutamate ligase